MQGVVNSCQAHQLHAAFWLAAYRDLYSQPPPAVSVLAGGRSGPLTRGARHWLQQPQQPPALTTAGGAWPITHSVRGATHVELAADPEVDDYHEHVATNQATLAALSKDFQQLGVLEKGCEVSADIVGWGGGAKGMTTAIQRAEFPAPSGVATFHEPASDDDDAVGERAPGKVEAASARCCKRWGRQKRSRLCLGGACRCVTSHVCITKSHRVTVATGYHPVQNRSGTTGQCTLPT